MATLNLAAYKPSSGQAVSASPISNAFTAIEAAVNSIDNTQFAAGRIFDATKLIEASSVQRIADSTLGGSAASIDFTSISANFAHLVLMLYLRGDTALTDIDVGVRLNNDSGANYSFQQIEASAATVTGSDGIGGTSLRCGRVPANSAPANEFGAVVVELPRYSGSSNHKTLHARSVSREGTVSGTLVTRSLAGVWFAASAAVNRITIIPSSGNFVTDCRASVYGLG